jgi:ketosteroid isomerase-like protein
MDDQELRDKFEIQDLLTRYAHAVNRSDWELIRTMFTEDAVIDLEAAGMITATRDEMMAALERTMGTLGWTQGFLSNVDVQLDGDTAIVTAMMMRAMQIPGVDGPSFAGSYYHHEMVRTPDGWKSRRFSEEPIWMTNPPSGSVPA